MPAPNLPVEANELPKASHHSAPKVVAQERRESERVITDWEQETDRLGRALAFLTVNTSEMMSERWVYRFIIALRPVVEDCILLFYGAKIRISDGAAGAAREARSFHPYGRAITRAVCASVHQGLRRRDVAGRTRPDAGRSRAGGWAARAVPGSVYRRQSRTEASAAPCGRRL
jgi:hypothetical protein